MGVDWIAVARRLQTIAQAGLTYAGDPHDQERYVALREVAAGIVAAAGATGIAQAGEVLALERGYATPKVDVRAAVFRGGQILLVRERADGLWSLPGGWADLGETPAEGAVREVAEEAGLAVRPVKVLAVWDRDRHGHPPLLWHVYKIFIRCELAGGGGDAAGGPAENLETDGAGFFARDALPPLSTDRVTAAEIARLFAHLDRPDLPTDFDV